MDAGIGRAAFEEGSREEEGHRRPDFGGRKDRGVWAGRLGIGENWVAGDALMWKAAG
jgi:hypothetical protein